MRLASPRISLAAVLALASALLPLSLTAQTRMIDRLPPVTGASELAEAEQTEARAALARQFADFTKGAYRINGERVYRLPHKLARWAAYQQRLDNEYGGSAARVAVPGHRAGHELYGIWRTPSGGPLVAAIMSKDAVDDAGHHLLAYYEVAPAQ